MEDWRKEYEKRLISAEEAAKLVKSGDRIAFASGREAFAVGLAIAARKNELKNVKIFLPSPGYDFGWYDPGWEDSFEITVMFPTATCQQMLDERRCDFNFGGFIPFQSSVEVWGEEIDILLVEVSPPDEHGFCSFGQSLWGKKRDIRKARERGKLVIAEVNENLIRTYGDNYIHFSEIDYFVPHVRSGGEPGKGTLAGRHIKEPEPYLKDICGYVSELIHDRDTIQIGVGRTTEPLVRLGLLDNKHDIGYHSEATPPGIITLVREGVISGKYKTINQGKVTVTSLGGGTREEMEWASNNPLFQLVDVEYLEDVRVIAAHDNMVAINQALAVDLSGQITAEGLGTSIRSISGGQLPFVIGAWLSRGGRSITVLPSTAQGGKVSRILPLFPEGTPVTIPRNCADYVVTEYGIASLRGKSIRQRAEELISIAHPDFRSKLKEEALRLYWPH